MGEVSGIGREMVEESSAGEVLFDSDQLEKNAKRTSSSFSCYVSWSGSNELLKQDVSNSRLFFTSTAKPSKHLYHPSSGAVENLLSSLASPCLLS